MNQLLLLEDDAPIARSLSLSLSYQGFNVTIADSLVKAAGALARASYRLLLLDVNLPDGTGFDLCRELRERKVTTPIIMLTARTDEDSAVRGMNLGADDYVRKPFGVAELVARINRLLDRKASTRNVAVSFGKLKINSSEHRAWAEDREIVLSKREFEILHQLVKRQGEVATRDDILNALGDQERLFDRTIDSHLSHVRKKLKEASAGISIVPVYGVGYRMELH